MFTRIGRSKIHGIGILAIRNIKKGTSIFYGDDEPIYWVAKKKVRRLPDGIRKLYEDFLYYQRGALWLPQELQPIDTGMVS